MFDRSYQSRVDRKNDYLRPLSIRAPLPAIKEALEAFLKEKGFSSIEFSQDYEEVFAIRDGYELTVSFLKGADTVVDLYLLVHTKKFFGGAKKFLLSLAKDLLAYFQRC